MSARMDLKPIVITSHPANYILGVFMLLASPLLMLAALDGGSPFVIAGVIAFCLLAAFLALMLLIGPRLQRITVSTEGVTIEQKRSNIHAELPWDGYRIAYRLSGYKASYLLFTPAPLSKQAQYEAVNACTKATDVPFSHDGCLVLPGNLYYSQILQRLPEHIRIAPEYECGTLWNKGRG